MPSMPDLHVSAAYQPTGDQPRAIRELAETISRGDQYQTLLGATATGKTHTMARVIEKVQKPTLVIAHNKTLAAQLCNEFREYFPTNTVEYFVSYYDYYQPEAYLPSSTRTSRRTPRSTTTSTASGMRRPRPSSRAATS